jgi:uncharacterized protein
MAISSFAPRRRLFLTSALAALAETELIAQARASGKVAKLTVEEAVLKPDTIPAKDVISGNPRAGDLVFSKSLDSREIRGIWSCTRGSFHWTFDTDETAVILHGRVTVQMEDGTSLELKQGDVALFPQGLKSIWMIHEDLRKVYVLYG